MINSQLQLTKTNYNKLAFCITSGFYAVFLGVFITFLHNAIDLNIAKGHIYNTSLSLNLVQVEDVIKDHLIEDISKYEEIKDEKIIEPKERSLDGFKENKVITQEVLDKKRNKEDVKKVVKKEIPIKNKVQNVQDIATNTNISTTVKSNKKESSIAQDDMDINLSYGSSNNNILAHFKKAIDQNIVYERRARIRKLSGTVLLEFRFTKDRELSFVRILKSSGSNLLDENAIATIKKAYKDFPKVSNNYLITIPITYRLI